MHKHGRANGVLERVFTHYLLPLQMPWGPQQPILPQVPVVGHAGLGPKDDYHFMQVAGAKSLDLHKALAGDRAPYHNFLQASRHLQSMCLIPDGDPANGICMGNLIEVVQRSAVSIYDNNTREETPPSHAGNFQGHGPFHRVLPAARSGVLAAALAASAAVSAGPEYSDKAHDPDEMHAYSSFHQGPALHWRTAYWPLRPWDAGVC